MSLNPEADECRRPRADDSSSSESESLPISEISESVRLRDSVISLERKGGYLLEFVPSRLRSLRI
jgi:hypothetical protein